MVEWNIMSERSRRRLSFAADQVDDQYPSSKHVCALCKQHHSHISKVATWQSTQAQDEVAKFGITVDDMVCQPCRDNVQKILGCPDHTPRWEKRKKNEVKCCVKGCDNGSSVHNRAIEHNTIQQVFDDVGLQIEGDTIPFPTPLCCHHYYTVCNTVQSHSANCRTCGICLKHVNSRQCPNAEIIFEHLRETAGFEGTLATEDKVCYSCYKSHLIILQE